MIHYAAWIARRWEDPTFPRAFPEFGSMKYWMEEYADLEEILKAEKARVLEKRGRRDVIQALSRHAIGYHSNFHSVHPTPAEYPAGC